MTQAAIKIASMRIFMLTAPSWLRTNGCGPGLESLADVKVEPEFFVFPGDLVEGVAHVELHGTDGRLDPDADANALGDVSVADRGRVEVGCADVIEDRALDDIGVDRESVLGIPYPVGVAADGVERAHVA